MTEVSFADCGIVEYNSSLIRSIYFPVDKVLQHLEEGETIEINVKKLFARLFISNSASVLDGENKSCESDALAAAAVDASDKEHDGTALSTAVASSSNATDDDPFAKLKNRMSGNDPIGRPRNRYEDIVERLERKYYAQSFADELRDSDEDEEEGVVLNKSHSPVGNVSKKQQQKKRKSREYDMDDPFIDDSEIIEQYESIMRMKHTKTKVNGFFVSAGDADFSAGMSPLPMKKKKKHKHAVEVDAADGVAVKRKKKKTNDINAVEVQKEGVEKPKKKKKHDSGREETEQSKIWMPSVAAITAMEQFKEIFDQIGIKLCKNSNIPKEVEGPLHVMDRRVLKEHDIPELTLPTKGYAERIQEIMGGEITLTKIRGLLVRLRLKDRASKAFDTYDKLMGELCREIKTHIIPCPAELQPSNIADTAPSSTESTPAQQAVASSKVDFAVDAEGAAAGSSMNDDVDGEKDSTKVSTAMAINVNDDIIPGDGPAEGTCDNSPEDGVLVAESQETLPSKANVVEKNEPTESIAMGTENTQPRELYKWACNWTPEMRTLLVSLDNAMRIWIDEENNYREKLTNYDKKFLEPSEIEYFIERTQIKVTLKKIAKSFPPSCVGSDWNSIRKILNNSKAKMRKNGAISEITAEVQRANENAGSPPLPDPAVSMSSPQSKASETPHKEASKQQIISWTPHEDAFTALDNFKSAFMNLNLKLSKASNIPKEVEAMLLVLDSVVQKQHSILELNSTTLKEGYIERIRTILGGEIASGKIRNLMIKLRLREQAAASARKFLELRTQLLEEIPRNIVPCPEDQQPKLPVFDAEVSTTSVTKDDGAPSAEEDVTKNEAIDAMQIDQSTEKDNNEQHTEQSEPKLEEVPQKAAPIRYEYICNWTPQLRVLLMETEYAMRVNLDDENDYREKLTNYDKKFLQKEDIEYLMERAQSKKFLNSICEVFPPSCLHGDIAALRKLIRNEKLKQQRKR